jgi:hypothetical protein
MKKKLLRRTIVVLGAVLVLLIAAMLSRDILLKSLAARGIEDETGLRAVIGELTTTLGSGALHVRDLKLYNPAEFGGELMAEFILSELNIVKNAAGRSNLDGVEKRVRERQHLRRKRKGEKFEFEFAGLEEMQLTLRKVLYTDLKPPARTRTLDLAVTDEVVTGLKTEEDLGRWAGGMMFRILMQISLGQFGTSASSNPGAAGVNASP